MGRAPHTGVPEIVAHPIHPCPGMTLGSLFHPYPAGLLLGWVHFVPLLTTVLSLLEYFNGFDSCNDPDGLFGLG
jgi:hypothetical protein